MQLRGVLFYNRSVTHYCEPGAHPGMAPREPCDQEAHAPSSRPDHEGSEAIL